MDRKNVLVTGIGGNVGQGIIRNIRSTKYNVRVIGTNVVEFSAGNHLCDVFHKVPYAVDKSYIATIQQIVENEQIDLIIPSTDYESSCLAQNRAEIDTVISSSDEATCAIYLDKYEGSAPFKVRWIF
ncbi:MAG: hypothetical protein ACKVHQ_15220 [Gammaproteobacteria bacterium]